MKKVLEFFKHFTNCLLGFMMPAFLYWYACDIGTQLADGMFYLRPEGTPLEGIYLNYFYAMAIGSLCVMYIGLLGYSIYSVIHSIRVASANMKAAKLASALTDPEA